MIIDGDGHYLEPVSLWSEYVPSAWRDQIYVELDDSDRARRIVLGDSVNDLVLPEHTFGAGDLFNPGGLKRGKLLQRPYEESEAGGWDPWKRLAMHDAEGIDAAVLFPTFGLCVASITDPTIGDVAAKAINEWAADYCSAAPSELYGVAVLPTHDPSVAAAELERCVARGFVAGCVRPNPTRDGRTLAHESFDPLWAMAQELDVPICIHNATNPDLPQTGMDRAATFVLRHAAVHSLEAMLAFGTLYEGRFFDRFSRLRVGFMESGCGWAPFWLDRLDEHVEQVGWMFDPPLTRTPTEVFIEQCVIGCEGDERMVPDVQLRYGDRSVLWASDYPHFDTEPPYAQSMLERPDLTDSQRQGVLSDAAVSFYRLDVEAIAHSRRHRLATL